MKYLKTILLFLLAVQFTNAQQNDSPYEWKWKRDGIWLGTAVATTGAGLYIISKKESYNR